MIGVFYYFVCCLPHLKTPNTNKLAKIKLVKDTQSNELDELLKNKTKYVIPYDSFSIFRDTNEKCELVRFFFKTVTKKTI